MTFSPEEKLQLKMDDVVWREVGGELVVLELSTSVYLTLNGTAKLLWEALSGGATSETLVETLTREYDIGSDQARTDVEGFLEALTHRNLLVHAK
jgi:hypothetical protein